MSRFCPAHLPPAAGIAILAFASSQAEVAAQSTYPNFQSGPGTWTHPFGGEFPAVQGSATPMRNDPAHPHVPNGLRAQPTYRIADLSNPFGQKTHLTAFHAAS